MPPLAAPYTRFNGRLGRERTVAAGTWPKARIQALQDKAGVTRNDAVTAVVAGVLRRWLLDRGELPKQSLVATCPITVRSRERVSKERHNNMFGAWLCPLGTQALNVTTCSYADRIGFGYVVDRDVVPTSTP